MRGGSRESKGDAHLEIFGRESGGKGQPENEITEEDSKGGSRVSEDRSLSHTSIYEQKSDGTQTPYVSKEMAPEIEGMVIAADGGDDPVVVKNLTEAVQALFGVEAHKIKIMKRTNA